eukprot:Transcript_15501.p1 GENE.Transcript_15501~~Transcript_15501.p1  ORF type:complete len:368 (-),score=111.46 Transcript_15501:154-1257(-)
MTNGTCAAEVAVPDARLTNWRRGTFSLIEAMPDDVLTLVLAALFEFSERGCGTRALGAAAQACKRMHSHATEPALLRRLLCQSLIAAKWSVCEQQLTGLSPPDTLRLLREPDVTPTIRLAPSRSSRISISDEGLTVRFLGNRLGGNRAVRADLPLPCSTYNALRPVRADEAASPLGSPRSPASSSCSGGGGGRFALQRGCCTAYFEVTILPPPVGRHDAEFDSDCIAVGLCTARFVRDGKQPGWDAESFGYHGDDGRLFHGSGTQSTAYGPTFRSGDVVGCGISTASRRVFFTLNGEYLGPAFTARPQQLPLFPVVGIDSFAPVRFNFGAEPFAFDVAAVPASLHVVNRRMRVSRCFGGFGNASVVF